MIKINKLATPRKLINFKTLSGFIGGTQGYYELDSDTKNDLREHLLEETRYRCAYCMQPLSKRSTIIEHIKPYSLMSKKESLDYNNLVINCKTSNIPHLKLKSCSDHKGDSQLIKVNRVLFSNIEDYLYYEYDGVIRTLDSDIENDIKILNLNNSNLVENRYRVIINTIKMIKEKTEFVQYSAEMKKKYIEHVRRTSFPYPGVVIDLFKKSK